ncbi:MAG: cellulase family glycosylhydrolase, partial [Ignavibacteria bacterium]|nr:cellulase family glycosylhydrolase [Ignavibacteria bacterium]
MKKLCKLLLIFLLIFGFGNRNTLLGQKKEFIYTDNGRLYFPNGEEVSLWGVNFQPNLSWEYNSRFKPIGVPLEAEVMKKNTDAGFDEIQKMNCKLIRCHLTPADFTDDNGNLVETIYLDLLDYMVAEASKRGIYVYIAFLNHMNSGYSQNSFMNKVKREEWIYNSNTVKCAENYIKQLLNRKNSYTKIQYKKDPNIAVWEIINEPGYYSYEKIVGSPFYPVFTKWLTDKKMEDTKKNYLVYRKQLVLDYINSMYDLIRETGASQPVVWNCNWHKMIIGNEDIFEAAAASKVEVVSFCTYPGQNECKQPYYQNPEDFTKYNFSTFFKNGYEKRDWYGWALDSSFMKKAKVVYEFETFYNQSAYLYPAMADFFRSMGVQMAAMWTYCLPGYAQYSSGSHFLNLTTTPQKSASFIVAGEIFKSAALYKTYSSESPVEKKTKNYAYSFSNNLSVFASADKYFYSGDMLNWNPIEANQNVKEIKGFGNSSLI